MHGRSVDAIPVVVEDESPVEVDLHAAYPAHRRTGLLRYGQGVGRVGIMLCVALPLAAADLLVKAYEPTEPWAYHERSLGWLALSISLLAGMVGGRPDSLGARGACGGRRRRGVLGNSLSAAWNDMEVPNPLILGGDDAIVAFNLADVWALTGILLLVCTLGVWLIRNRDLIPPPEEVRSTRGRAFKRLFEDDRP